MGGVGDGNGFSSHRQTRTVAALARRSRVKQKNTMPARVAAGGYVTDVKNGIGELLLEDASPNFSGQLAGDELILDFVTLAERPGSEPQRGRRSHQGRHQAECQNRGSHPAASLWL